MRKELFVANEYYHIYNRGVDKRKIFLDERDRIRFIHTFYILNNFLEIPPHFDFINLEPKELLQTRKEPFITIAAGCLMTTHFHFLLSPTRDENISKFFHKMGVSYTKYFNKRRERSGSLFESTFKARCVNTHEYAAYLSQYIHLNPLDLFRASNEKELWQKVKEYQWSTLPDYLGKKSKLSILLNDSFRHDVLDMDNHEYEKFLFELYQEQKSSQI